MNRLIDLEPSDKIIVCRTDRIGDLILAVPFIETLKTRYPGVSVEVMASDYAAPILKYNPYVDAVFSIDHALLKADVNYRKSFLKRLRESGYRVAAALYPERHISFFLWKAAVPVRIGSGRRLHSIFFNRHLYHSRNAAEKHESEYNLDFLEFFKSGPLIKEPRLYLKPEEIKSAQALLTSKGIEPPFVVLHPGTGGSTETWPPDNFFALYSDLQKAGVQTLLTGSKAEIPMITDGARRAGIEPVSLAGETDLRSLAAVLSLADVVVANSTGPLHLAAATGTRVVGLYPQRRVMAPLRWGPIGTGHCIIQPERPAMGMNTIAVDKVRSAVLAKLKELSTAR
ncbi:putative ADP-heptose-LPS heptosyltransferase [Candidatus Zixiibacteriota bacterium]|nr:putative ADP-heptose-LPS heptosyltransferase [candidate division Zixibacteria bacterium]